LVTFYADRDGFMHGVSPLEDLANINIAHWQSTSDQRAILTVSRFAMLALSGGSDDEGKLTIGPNRWLWTQDPSARFYYVEHSGTAIGAGREDLVSLEQQMGEYGAEFLKKRPGDMTATARALDSAEATSPLQDVTRRFADAMNTAMYYHAAWMQLEDGGTVEVSTDFGPEQVNSDDLATLRETRKNRDLSLQTYLEELQRRGILPEELDVEEEMGRIEDETLRFTPAPLGGELETVEETAEEEELENE
jgi:hypothetical protein